MELNYTAAQVAAMEKKNNQLFCIRDILISHCGQDLSASKINSIMVDIEKEITRGDMAWAFK